MVGSTVLSGHIKDSDISNSVESVHRCSEVEERWIDLVRIVNREQAPVLGSNFCPDTSPPCGLRHITIDK